MAILFPPQFGGYCSNSAANDPIWDAVGDLAVGTGNNAASALTKGSEDEILVVGSSTLEWTDSPVIDGGTL